MKVVLASKNKHKLIEISKITEKFGMELVLQSELGVDIDAVLSIELSDDAIVERMSGRRLCAACGATWHVKSNPTEDGVHCDKCGAPLTMRADDKPEVVLNRLSVYHAETEPLIGYYSSKGLIRTVSGQNELAETTALVKEALGI